MHFAQLLVLVVPLSMVGSSMIFAQQTASTPFMALKARAEKGDPEAQSRLGYCYAQGDGVAKSMLEAAAWWRKSAEQGNTAAQFNLGLCHAVGNGVPRDSTEAAKWYRKSAEQGDSNAQNNLGHCYYKGDGVGQDFNEAVRCWRKAAEQGHTEAQCSLAECYSKGTGVHADQVESVKWYRFAADQGNSKAQIVLGRRYYNGVGVSKNFVEALSWYRKAAEQGVAEAQACVAFCFMQGDGVPTDYVEAHRWSNLAGAQGDDDGKNLRIELETRMTATQIAEAQQLARAFKPRKRPSSAQNFRRRPGADAQVSSTGTGFFVTDDGFLITNAHVVKDADAIRVRTLSGTQDAVLRKVDAANDLALLRVDGQFFALPIVNSHNVRIGNKVATVGFPNVVLQGLAPKLASGEIAAVSGAMDDPRFFQISVPVQPGNSGGALVDTAGNVVGVIAAKLSLDAAISTSGALPENVNYAVKSSFLLGFLEAEPELSPKLKQRLQANRPFEEVVKSVQDAIALILVY